MEKEKEERREKEKEGRTERVSDRREEAPARAWRATTASSAGQRWRARRDNGGELGGGEFDPINQEFKRL
ncbi:hypothetical protein Syun_003721 [Stephania yunnanensis]|uniref:Uncharacterized protein n=1 Tax=Stephania yunnanensis TaxID=152371 RepID=A0AAP0Q1V8_9MAGN